MSVKKILSIFALTFAFSASAQSVTFELEDLSKPESLLSTKNFSTLYNDLLGVDYELNRREMSDFQGETEVLYHSLGEQELVNDYYYNPFLFGLCEAYAHHRPVIFSPDMIWLLITQGFSAHVNANSETLRSQIVNFEGKSLVLVGNAADSLEQVDWQDVIGTFSEMLSQDIKGDLAKTLICDFTTTTLTERVASQIVLMDAVKSYYEFMVIRGVCGIPSITLEGTTRDWQKLKDKTLNLEKYDLKWWTNRLVPILDEFIAASQGNVNKEFWTKMVHVTEPKACGDPRIIDGWMINFYPYDKNGKRFKGDKITDADKLPREMVKVNVQLVCESVDGVANRIPVELWAGFWGLEQNKETFALKPAVGWMVKRENANQLEEYKFGIMNSNSFGIMIKVRDRLPEVLMEFDNIPRLVLEFENRTVIEDWFYTLNIERLEVKGKLTLSQKRKMKKHFPNFYFESRFSQIVKKILTKWQSRK